MLILAPMAGYTDSAFRLLCREMGADIVISELISADAIAYGKFKVESRKSKVVIISNKNKSTAELLSFYKAERPLIIQLFGKKPTNFGLSAKWISENLPVDGIDINMGCPARKVVGSDHGAALLKNPTLAIEIIKAVKSNTFLPVSVKTRLGWENDDEILEFAPLLAKAGIDAIIIHGRTYKDGFKGKARWENIYKVKELLGDKVAVIGNGDIKSVSSIKYKVSRGGKQAILDGVAIGRATFGNPGIFKSMKSNNSPQPQTPNPKLPSPDSKLILRHAELAYEMKGEHGIIEFRKHLLSYLKGMKDAKNLRKEAVRIEKINDIEAILSKLPES